MHDLAVEISAPVAVDDVGEEQAGDQEEIGHAERQREGDHGVHPAVLAEGGFDAERRMHHHHKDDAEALGVIDPVDPPVVRFHPAHGVDVTESGSISLYVIAESRSPRLAIRALL